jgi:hypothetical protein
MEHEQATSSWAQAAAAARLPGWASPKSASRLRLGAMIAARVGRWRLILAPIGWEGVQRRARSNAVRGSREDVRRERASAAAAMQN